MHRTEDILEGARAIRPYLPELVGAEAENIDGELADLLARADQGQKTDTLILDLLSTRKATKDWMRDYLDEPVPSMRWAETKDFNQPGGDPDPISAQKYVCPVIDHKDWFRQYAGEEIPMCEIHKVRLVPAP